jgi:hypothetical protein
MTYSVAVDEKGAPILLAPAAAAKPKAKAQPKLDPQQGSAARRRDAVVDAARSLEDLSPAGVEAFVRRRWRGDRPVTPEDFASFSVDARAQRKHDIVDALHHRINRAVNGRAGSKQPHLSIPRGLGSKALASLEPEEMTDVVSRLRDRGWDQKKITRDKLIRGLPKEILDALRD